MADVHPGQKVYMELAGSAFLALDVCKILNEVSGAIADGAARLAEKGEDVAEVIRLAEQARRLADQAWARAEEAQAKVRQAQAGVEQLALALGVVKNKAVQTGLKGSTN